MVENGYPPILLSAHGLLCDGVGCWWCMYCEDGVIHGHEWFLRHCCHLTVIGLCCADL